MKTRPIRFLVPLALSLAISACNPMRAVQQTDATLGLDATTSGEITSSSPLNYNDGSHHQRYTMALKDGQAVSLELTGALEGSLAIFDGNVLVAKGGAASHYDEHGSSSTSGPVSVAFKAPKEGKYVVAVNSVSDKAFGPFKLKTAPIVPYDGKPLAGDSEIIDWLTADKQEYALKVAKAGIYTIAMDSTALDPLLRLNGKGVELENDDSNGSTNAKLTAYLEPGDYTITSSALENRTGSFKLKINMAAAIEGMVVRNGTALTPGQSAHGLIDSSGRRSFSLQLAQPRHIQFDALSDNMDTVLQVTGPGVNAEDDDGGGGTNARLELHLAAGTYTVIVRSLGDTQGPFELQTLDLGTTSSGSRINNNLKEAASEASDAAAAAAAEAASATADPAG